MATKILAQKPAGQLPRNRSFRIPRPPRVTAAALPLAAALLLSTPAGAAETPAALTDLSLEDLMQIKVTSVSRKPQRLANVAAAVHVITAEDIRLSGSTSIPEALRLAPGIDATRVSGNRWAVSTRGFAEALANKLLVLVDGRNAFSPAFNGVLWQDFQFPLEDVERIEVINGPASATWGSNGVNGVINIITKSAASTQGALVTVGAGRNEGEFGRARWGGSTPEGDLYYRGYVSGQNANAARAIDSMGGGNGHDAYRSKGAGLRFDGYLKNGDRWDLSADYFDNDGDVTAYTPLATGASNELLDEKHRGLTLRARYEKPLENGGNLQFQGAYAHTRLELPNLVTDRRDTFDLDMQHRLKLGERQDVVWGINYRSTSDDISGTPVMSMNDSSERIDTFALFAQDEIRMLVDLHLTLGLRMEHNSLTGWNSQPTARLAWTPLPTQTLWGALSKTSRAPSRGERGFSLNNLYMAGPPIPFTNMNSSILAVAHGAENFGDEELKAAEIGWRSQWATNLSTDLSLFEHRYSNIRMSGNPTVNMSAFPLIIYDIPIINGGEMTIRGVELAADWRITPSWRIRLAQTWNDPDNSESHPSMYAGLVPRQISSLRTSWAPASNIDIDAWYRHTGARPSPMAPAMARKSFDSLDLRAAWRPKKGVELSLTGKNLLDSECDAYSGLNDARENVNIVPTCLPRGIIGQATFEF